MKKFLFIPSQNQYHDKALNIPLSHDYKGLILLSGLSKLDWECFYYDIDSKSFKKVISIFPIVKFLENKEKLDKVDVIFCNYDSIKFFDEVKDKIIDIQYGKKILDIPAIHWMEDPQGEQWKHEIFKDKFKLISNYSTHITTTNKKMEVYLNYYFQRYFRMNYKVFTTNIGCSKQEKDFFIKSDIVKKLRIDDTKINIINSGGAWGWTDISTFLEVYIEFCKTNPNKFCFICPGLIQEDNADPENLKERKLILNMIEENKEIIKNNFIFSRWSSRYAVLEYLSIADIGLSISKFTAESIFCSRVRSYDYISFEIPLVVTEQEHIALDISKTCSGWVVEPENKDNYMNILKNITLEEIKIKKKNMSLLIDKYEELNISKNFIKNIEEIDIQRLPYLV